MRHLFRLVVLAMVAVVALPAAAAPLELLVAKASAEDDDVPGLKRLGLDLTRESTASFATFTAENVGKTVEFAIDGKAVMAPRIMEPILGGRIVISGNFAAGEVEKIAERISAGSAKLTVEVQAGQ